MDLITIVSQNMGSVIKIVIAITGSIFATASTYKRKAIKEAVKKAKKDQLLLDRINALEKRVDLSEGHIELNTVSINDINTQQSSIEAKLENIEAQGNKTHAVLIMIQEKFMDSLINKK